ncbi:LacI family DNA-binding transcriptional regulator [Naasia lichenicola]|uniref:LacI family transcriptional regulator n=1 Tax=Naasia lichenicola TaxID=2565933 RepID=A0A4S4FH35_9MICO|nr:LacI family DNA-binding transcriptional regulator [Naasia lichenicola]THG29599.1 LacI family transcriptional regulator [Naasia lichenicola]
MGAENKVTIYSVAERAGVSISTVSLAINSPHRVSETTRARVIAAAGSLGYRAIDGGRRASGGTRIAVAAPFSSYSTYFRRFSGMLVRARDTAVELMAHDLESAASVSAPLLDALPARRGIDGLILMGVPLGSAALRASREAALPLVLIDVRRARPVGDDLPVVLVDDEEGGRAAGAHLRERGHERVIFLGEPQLSDDYVSAGMLRIRGLAEHVEVSLVRSPLHADPTPALLAALEGPTPPTAIVANHDELASRAWRGLAARGLRIPEDVAIVGYDDGPLADGLGLTTIRQPFEESGRVALELLLGAIAGTGGAVRRIDLTPTLVVRSST